MPFECRCVSFLFYNVATQQVCQQKFQFHRSAILSKWARVGDRCTKELFVFHEGPRRPINITELTDGDRVISTQSELKSHILEFYTTLYTRDNVVEENKEARTDCLQFVQRNVTEAHNLEL